MSRARPSGSRVAKSFRGPPSRKAKELEPLSALLRLPQFFFVSVGRNIRRLGSSLHELAQNGILSLVEFRGDGFEDLPNESGPLLQI